LTQISFFDDVSRDTYRLQADFTIVDETICPSQQLAENANTLSIACDASGYAQADNVRRYPHATNRKGIFVAGCARQPSDPMAQAMEARSVALSVMRFLEGEEHQALPTAAIHRQKCVRCLTCLRLCPYQAIALHAKPEIMPEACQGCGICAAECPAVAIEMDPLTHLAMTQKLTSLRSDHDQQRRDSPFLVAFCCARSAKIAQEMAFAMGHRLPPGLALVNVPCAGSISLGHLLAAFQSQADGVLVLTCHPDNCHSETGNLLAHQRATHLLALLPSLGIAQERIQVATLAANMGTEFARVASTFEKSIVALAANPIRI
jgi:coenzyme F420-reducing hydrogenase delta subunit/Pyruvate/2-oxoacid:ferredoxin oxidoreductase delta subunit